MMVSEGMSGRRDQGNHSLALGQYIAHRRTYSEVYTSTTSNPFFLNSDDGSNNNSGSSSSSNSNSNINSKTLALPPPLGFESRYQLQYSRGHGYGDGYGVDGDGYGYGGVSRAAKRAAAGIERRSSSWDVSEDPELRRRRRLASYKAYSLQGKVKSTVKQSFRWVKGKYNEIIYGFK